METPSEEFNFRPSSFPILIEAYRTDNKEIVWTAKIERPASGTKNKVEIPPLKKLHGCPVGIRIKFADEPAWQDLPELEN